MRGATLTYATLDGSTDNPRNNLLRNPFRADPPAPTVRSSASTGAPATEDGRTMRRVRRLLALLGIAALTIGFCPTGAAPTANASTAPPAPYTETYRPQFHFSPAKNWMNDPNGLVYYRGEYHLFFQYNPSGDTWGNMSWGHAVSRDLVHWKQLPVAIPQDAKEMAFSGSVIVDKANTSGFGAPGKPALVAIYTSADKETGRQAQSLAYSTDDGRTFTKYSGNPVLDIGSTNFRDPKVFWYAPGHEWLMTAALSDQHKVTFYSSPDLKHWKHLSDFGPAGATGGVWECPDLFPMPVAGHPGQTKWVLVVNLNPGGIAGGSGAQYFTGSFDGKRFVSDDKPYVAPTGRALGAFDDGGYDGWTHTGTAFGTSPTTGSLPGQQPVNGWTGAGYVNSFHGGDAGTGTLTSPSFTLDQRYLNFQIGGGNHPNVPGGSTAPPPGTTYADFEGATYGDGWTETGDFVGTGPTRESLPGQIGAGVLDTCVKTCDAAEGTITSPSFTIDHDYIDLLVAGGKHPLSGTDPTAVNLLVDGKVVATATGDNSGNLNWRAWDVRQWKGKRATIQVVDHRAADWGHLMVDNIVFSDRAAAPWDDGTSVNLLVDGKVVRTATGADAESLDWTSWDLQDLQGKTAQVQVVDHNTGGWGHVLADQFTLADQPATSATQRAHWIDYGKDDYAAVTYNNAPGGRRIMIGWMNNWNYGGSIPTSPWRSAMTVPRELSLQSVDGHARLVQEPVTELNSLAGDPATSLPLLSVPSGTHRLSASAKAARIDFELAPGTATTSGIEIRRGDGQATSIGYDARTGEVYVDRSLSGDVGFSTDFPGVQRAPVALHGGRVRLHVLVDWSSVEVFADDGRTLITDQIFPNPSSTGLATFATGGTATVHGLTVTPLRSAWTR